MEINKLNVAQIVSMQSHTNQECRDYKYFEESRFLFWKRPAGFYDVSWYDRKIFITEGEIKTKNDHLICKNKTVFYKPYLRFKMSDGSWHNKYFETEAALNKFLGSTHLSHIHWIDKK